MAVTQSDVSSPCHCDFPTVMNCSLELLLARALSPQVDVSRVLYHSHRKEAGEEPGLRKGCRCDNHIVITVWLFCSNYSVGRRWKEGFGVLGCKGYLLLEIVLNFTFEDKNAESGCQVHEVSEG